MFRFFQEKVVPTAKCWGVFGVMAGYSAIIYAIAKENREQLAALERNNPGCTIKWDTHYVPGIGPYWTPRVERPDSDAPKPNSP